MNIEEIPKSYRYNCDGCGAFHVQKNANGHYHNSTPPKWATIKIFRYDDNGPDRLLCDECAKPLVDLITNWKGKR